MSIPEATTEVIADWHSRVVARDDEFRRLNSVEIAELGLPPLGGRAGMANLGFYAITATGHIVVWKTGARNSRPFYEKMVSDIGLHMKADVAPGLITDHTHPFGYGYASLVMGADFASANHYMIERGRMIEDEELQRFAAGMEATRVALYICGVNDTGISKHLMLRSPTALTPQRRTRYMIDFTQALYTDMQRGFITDNAASHNLLTLESPLPDVAEASADALAAVIAQHCEGPGRRQLLHYISRIPVELWSADRTIPHDKLKTRQYHAVDFIRGACERLLLKNKLKPAGSTPV